MGAQGTCPRLPTIVVILRRKFPLERGPKGPQKCTIVDDCARITKSGLKPPFESPHLDFPESCELRQKLGKTNSWEYLFWSQLSQNRKREWSLRFESLAFVGAHIPPQNTGFGPHRPCVRCAAIRIARLAFIGVLFIPCGTAEWPARVGRVRWTLAIGDWRFCPSKVPKEYNPLPDPDPKTRNAK